MTNYFRILKFKLFYRLKKDGNLSDCWPNGFYFATECLFSFCWRMCFVRWLEVYLMVGHLILFDKHQVQYDYSYQIFFITELLVADLGLCHRHFLVDSWQQTACYLVRICFLLEHCWAKPQSFLSCSCYYLVRQLLDGRLENVCCCSMSRFFRCCRFQLLLSSSDYIAPICWGFHHGYDYQAIQHQVLAQAFDFMLLLCLGYANALWGYFVAIWLNRLCFGHYLCCCNWSVHVSCWGGRRSFTDDTAICCVGF